MNLVPVEHKLEDYELPDHRFATGTLEIEIDPVDGLPVVWAFILTVRNDTTGVTVTYEFTTGERSPSYEAKEIQQLLHKDTRLMDDIFDDCAREGMWT